MTSRSYISCCDPHLNKISSCQMLLRALQCLGRLAARPLCHEAAQRTACRSACRRGWRSGRPPSRAHTGTRTWASARPPCLRLSCAWSCWPGTRCLDSTLVRLPRSSSHNSPTRASVVIPGLLLCCAVRAPGAAGLGSAVRAASQCGASPWFCFTGIEFVASVRAQACCCVRAVCVRLQLLAWDPLFGQSARMLEGDCLLPSSSFGLSLAERAPVSYPGSGCIHAKAAPGNVGTQTSLHVVHSSGDGCNCKITPSMSNIV